jgi:hypothetical protein
LAALSLFSPLTRATNDDADRASGGASGTPSASIKQTTHAIGTPLKTIPTQPLVPNQDYNQPIHVFLLPFPPFSGHRDAFSRLARIHREGDVKSIQPRRSPGNKPRPPPTVASAVASAAYDDHDQRGAQGGHPAGEAGAAFAFPPSDHNHITRAWGRRGEGDDDDDNSSGA